MADITFEGMLAEFGGASFGDATRAVEAAIPLFAELDRRLDTLETVLTERVAALEEQVDAQEDALLAVNDASASMVRRLDTMSAILDGLILEGLDVVATLASQLPEKELPVEKHLEKLEGELKRVSELSAQVQPRTLDFTQAMLKRARRAPQVWALLSSETEQGFAKAFRGLLYSEVLPAIEAAKESVPREDYERVWVEVARFLLTHCCCGFEGVKARVEMLFSGRIIGEIKYFPEGPLDVVTTFRAAAQVLIGLQGPAWQILRNPCFCLLVTT